MTISIGEKVETVILTRANGAHGQYLGSSAETFGAARVDGMTFKVGSFTEIGAFKVLHVESGLVEEIEDRYEIPCAVDRLVKRAREAGKVEAVAHLQRSGYKAKAFGDAIRVIDPAYIMAGSERREVPNIVTLRGNDLPRCLAIRRRPFLRITP